MNTNLLEAKLQPQLKEAERAQMLLQNALALLKLGETEVMFTVIVRHYQDHSKQEKTRLTGKNLPGLLDQLTGTIKLHSSPGGSRYDDEEVLVCMHSPIFPGTFVLLDHSWVGMQHPDIDGTVWRAIPHTTTTAYNTLEELIEDPEVAYPDPS